MWEQKYTSVTRQKQKQKQNGLYITEFNVLRVVSDLQQVPGSDFPR